MPLKARQRIQQLHTAVFSFDLYITYPLVNSTSYYFLLKCGTSLDQYVQRRTFLQAVHVSVDYDIGYFNMLQARGGEGKANIVPILLLILVEANPKGLPTTRLLKELSTPQKAGIGVSVSTIVVTICFFFFLRRKGWWLF